MKTPNVLTRYTALGAITIVFLVAEPCVSTAQRPAPHITDYGLPATKEIVSGRLVEWQSWGLRVEQCRNRTGDMECTLTVMNGGDDSLTLCLGDAALIFPNATYSAKMSIRLTASSSRAPHGDEKKGYECLALSSHAQTLIALRSGDRVGRRPSELGITLIERPSPSNRNMNFKARARIPVGDHGRSEPPPAW